MGVIDGSGRDHSSHIFGGDEDDDVSTSEVDDQEAQTREGTWPSIPVITLALYSLAREGQRD